MNNLDSKEVEETPQVSSPHDAMDPLAMDSNGEIMKDPLKIEEEKVSETIARNSEEIDAKEQCLKKEVAHCVESLILETEKIKEAETEENNCLAVDTKDNVNITETVTDTSYNVTKAIENIDSPDCEVIQIIEVKEEPSTNGSETAATVEKVEVSKKPINNQLLPLETNPKVTPVITEPRVPVEIEKPTEVKAPEVEIPKSTVPEAKVPETKIPEVKIPEIKIPEVKIPEIKIPVVKTPDIKIPEVKIPEVVQAPVTVVPLVVKDEVPAAVKELISKTCENSVDVEMKDATESKDKDKTEHKIEIRRDIKPVNGECTKDEAVKRRASMDLESEMTPLKKLCQDIERSYPNHDAMLTDYIQNSSKNNVDEIQRHTEQLLSEIQTLREMAQKKEHEWNNILHLKKIKEEILLRLLRQKQVLSFEKSAEMNGTDKSEPLDINQLKNFAIDKSDEISGVAIKPPCKTNTPPMPPVPIMPLSTHYNPMSVLPPPYDKAGHMHNIPKNMFPSPMMLPGPTMPAFPRDMNGQLATNYGLPMGRQGPTKDVKSIIADYRQRNPDITPRRGRRMKSILNPNMMNHPRPIAPKLDGLNNLSNLGMMFNNFDMNQKAMLERLSQMQTTNLPNGLSFKDVLVQFANLQQQANPGLLLRPDMMPNRPPEHHQPRPSEIRNARRPEKPPNPHMESEMHISVKQCDRRASPSPRLPPPPPYPEISLLPVSSSHQEQTSTSSPHNSLLHGILTKQGSPASQSYSPTLAKLLTSPEQKQNTPTLPSFGQAKNCGEITITPVQPTPPPPADPVPEKTEEVVQLDDEETPVSDGEGSASVEGEERRLVIDEGGSEETPMCQGCRKKDALFVCAGCANQWYCSRDCQVSAWDEHSEMCTG